MLFAKRTMICIASLIAVGALFSSCDKPKEITFSGYTMGTTYSIICLLPNRVTPEEVKAIVEHELQTVNQSMSVFDPLSEISHFNALSALETKVHPFEATEAFYEVMRQAKIIHAQTNGVWDGTVKPLVDLWGFGAQGHANSLPDDENVQLAMENVGFDKITLGPDRTIIKEAEVSVDLSSIAKGYGVDRVAAALSNLGLENFLVEIGGEVYVKGLKSGNRKWLVGISKPATEMSAANVYVATRLSNQAMATSGSYRNFLKLDNSEKTITHIVDPRTGYPVDNRVVSVSVIAPNCTKADGLATAMFVMGIEQSLKLAENDSEIEIFLIEELPGGGFVNHMSSGMGAYLKQ